MLAIAMDVPHSALVIARGQIVLQGCPPGVRNDDAVRKAWLEV